MRSLSRRFEPGAGWRTARRITQSLAIVAIVASPFLGAWQRLYRAGISAWSAEDWELPLWAARHLPEAKGHAIYDLNQILGGGLAGDYFGVPAVDPVAALPALVESGFAPYVVLGWAIPVALGVLFGRVFCGWFCPFGLISRALDRALSLLPFRHRGHEIPRSRPVRWVLLALAIFGGAFGAEWLTYALLPHWLAQQVPYSMWLLGGGGAALGALAGLVGMGLFLGPTIYCATLCPTGAALSLAGRLRRAHVRVIDPGTCGACTLCHRACWLGLDPAAGDPGPDCDLCARCFTACPRSKMVIEIAPFVGLSRRLSVLLGIAAASTIAAAVTLAPAAAAGREKPALTLNGTRLIDDVMVSVTVLDLTDYQFTKDTAPLSGSEIAVAVSRGEWQPLQRPGNVADERDVYRGRLRVSVRTSSGTDAGYISFETPNHPMSTPARTIFRGRIDSVIVPGDSVVVDPVPGWFEEPVTFAVRDVHPGRPRFSWLFGLGTFIGFLGLGSLAIGIGHAADERAARSPASVPRHPHSEQEE